MTESAAMPERLDDEQRVHDIRKSKVRIYVTYAMTGAYIVAALGLIFWLMWQSKVELALGIFSGVASTTSAVIAFWFGSRGSARSPEAPGNRIQAAPRQ